MAVAAITYLVMLLLSGATPPGEPACAQVGLPAPELGLGTPPAATGCVSASSHVLTHVVECHRQTTLLLDRAACSTDEWSCAVRFARLECSLGIASVAIAM